MNKKIMLLAVSAVSAIALALPVTASALTASHISPVPAAPVQIAGGAGSLSTAAGLTITCSEVKGTATFENSTTGTMQLTFGGHCTGPLGVTCKSTNPVDPTDENAITTTVLPFHLTKVGTTGAVLVTPGANSHFTTISCAGIVSTVTGNGVIGTVETACGTPATKVGVNFVATAHGVQAHKTVAGTATSYELTRNGASAAQNATGTITFPSETTLTCT